MTDAQQRAAAKIFAKNWKDRGYEKGDSQIFWVELLTTVFGVTDISQFIQVLFHLIKHFVVKYCDCFKDN